MQLYVTYLCYIKRAILILSDLAILTLHPELISSIANKIFFTKPNSFTGAIDFPNVDPKKTEIFDKEIPEINRILKHY